MLTLPHCPYLFLRLQLTTLSSTTTPAAKPQNTGAARVGAIVGIVLGAIGIVLVLGLYIFVQYGDNAMGFKKRR